MRTTLLAMLLACGCEQQPHWTTKRRSVHRLIGNATKTGTKAMTSEVEQWDGTLPWTLKREPTEGELRQIYDDLGCYTQDTFEEFKAKWGTQK